MCFHWEVLSNKLFFGKFWIVRGNDKIVCSVSDTLIEVSICSDFKKGCPAYGSQTGEHVDNSVI